jgi:uncharacterized protein
MRRGLLSRFILAGLCWLIASQPPFLVAQQQNDLATKYEKREAKIAMRDGVKLHVSIYSPRDKSQPYPIMLNRTCYSCQPYGEQNYPNHIGPSKFMEAEGYIFVKCDVRGRWNSEGKFDNMRPHVPGDGAIDESSDTYDTIEWLLKNVPNNNGKVGISGISYPGFYSAAALPEHHPALVAASPQAPVSDFYFDDFHHQGAFLLSYFVATATFGYQHNGPTTTSWYKSPKPSSEDAWTFYRSITPLNKAKEYYGEDNFFWQELVEHPNYDEFWQKRSILPHLKNVKTNVMTVGGFFDAEDLYGPLHIYQELEKNNPGIHNTLVMGPWGHGDWARATPIQVVGNVPFGPNIAEAYQRDIEAPFFRHFLKGVGEKPNTEAHIFDTGHREWKSFESWPPKNASDSALYLSADRRLTTQPQPSREKPFDEFTSNPADPVPYRDRPDIRLQFTPRQYMTDNQKFASQRRDVLVFETDVLQEPLTIVGDITAELFVSTSQSDADWVVKLIDVYPDDHPQLPGTPANITLAGYQQMVRSEVLRGRFRNSFERPEPFESNKVTQVNVPLQDVLHTFKPGHRVMVQLQSSWFPLIDLNPQKFVPNIFKATEEDFVPAVHRVYHDEKKLCRLKIRLLPSVQQRQ